MYGLKAAAIGLTALVVSTLCVSPLEGQQQGNVTNEKASQLTTALHKMEAMCKELIEIRMQEYQLGLIDFQQLISVKHQLLELELKLARTPQERMKVLSEHLKLAKQFEELCARRYEIKVGVRSDLLQAQIAKMRIEILILEEHE